jgi:hypothetical protein
MKIALVLFITILTSLLTGQDVRLVDFKSSGCDMNNNFDYDENLYPWNIKSRIIRQVFHQDTLEIEVGTLAKCCVSFEPYISFATDTLNLNYNETQEMCECDGCCYQFTYFITGLKGKDFGVKLRSMVIQLSDEKYITYPVKYYIFNGDTTGYKDKYGRKQGIIISKRETGQLFETHYTNGRIDSTVLKDCTGKIIEIK